MKKIAIIGSGISGTSSAYYLNKLGYTVTIFEANNYFGGHTNTVEIEIDDKKIPVDTGFLVHNDRTYPNLINFLKELKVEVFNSDMTFSVEKVSDNIAWAGTNLTTLFAQTKNLFRLSFWKFLLEILRFNKNSTDYLATCENDLDLSLEELLEQNNYSENFRNWYLLPMGGCIWSTPTEEMLKFPAYTFLKFCINHGLLQISNRPKWKTIKGGCRTYVERALNEVEAKYLNEKVLSVENNGKGVAITTSHRSENFDYCVFSAHAPQSLAMIKNPSHLVSSILSSFYTIANKAVLHLDESVLPKEKRAWAAWNYLSVKSKEYGDKISVTYLMNLLQPLETKKNVLVSLNPVTKIDESKILYSVDYAHPIFDSKAIKAQSQIDDIQGEQGMFFCGAWQRYGFHEDGILSAKIMINHILKADNKELIKIL